MIIARRRFLFLAPAIIAAPSLMKLSALHLPEPATLSDASTFRVVRAILDGMVKGRRPEDIVDDVITLTTVHAPPAKGERVTLHGLEPSGFDGDYVVI